MPRQKIYEVVNSLVEKGFALVVQEKTKLFSAVEPGLAIPNYVARRRQLIEHEFTEQSRLASAVVEDLRAAYAQSQEGRGTLDFLRIVSDPGQAAVAFQQMLAGVREEYLEFVRPPFAAPVERDLLAAARQRKVVCRMLVEATPADGAQGDLVSEYIGLGIKVRRSNSLPMKLAVFDGHCGMIALLDPVVTKPSWTTVIFNHAGMAQAMKGLFEDYWRKADLLDKGV